MPGLMRGGWKRGRVSGLPSLRKVSRDSAGPSRLPRQPPTLPLRCTIAEQDRTGAGILAPNEAPAARSAGQRGLPACI